MIRRIIKERSGNISQIFLKQLPDSATKCSRVWKGVNATFVGFDRFTCTRDKRAHQENIIKYKLINLFWYDRGKVWLHMYKYKLSKPFFVNEKTNILSDSLQPKANAKLNQALHAASNGYFNKLK